MLFLRRRNSRTVLTGDGFMHRCGRAYGSCGYTSFRGKPLNIFLGHINATPVFVKDERYGIVGGFSLQEFWPVPIMLLTVITGDFPSIDVVQMPDWWPLIRPPAHILQNTQAIYLMLPVVAALGYGDIALTKTPKNRCKSSAVNLLAFSCILLLLSVLASRYMVFTLAAIFAPAGHEFLIITGKKVSGKTNYLLLRKRRDDSDIIKIHLQKKWA